MKVCAACGSPLWSGHVCPRRAISDRLPEIVADLRRSTLDECRVAWLEETSLNPFYVQP